MALLCQYYSNYTPYSGKFFLVQNFTKLHQTLQKKIFTVFIFIFMEQMLHALTTPLPVDGHAPHANQRNDTERWSEEASLCNNNLLFLLCGGLRNYESIRTAAVGEKLAFWTERFCTADLDFDNLRVSLTGSLAVAGWSSLQRLFRGQIEWQTLENHLVHTGTSSYQRAHILMSPIFILVYSFAVFIFEEAGLSTKAMKICIQWKFPAIWYLY